MSLEERARGRILFADDDEAVLRPTSKALQVAGFVVDAFPDAEHAQAGLRAKHYDAILADINMPGNQRLEFVEALGRAHHMVPIVILTGFPTLDTAISALRLGVVDYITKPPDLMSLFERLDRAVQRGRMLRSLSDAEARLAHLGEWLNELKTMARFGSGFNLRPGGASEPTSPNPRPSVDAAGAFAQTELEQLSPREREVATQLALGHPVRETAQILGVSTSTVRNHLKSIFVKLKVNSQVALLGKLTSSTRQTRVFPTGDH